MSGAVVAKKRGGLRSSAVDPSTWARMPLATTRPAGGAWSVAHTKPRQEKALGDALGVAGICCFVPCFQQSKVYGHRHRVTSHPLFPGYAFVFATREQVAQALMTNRVASILRVQDQDRLEFELTQVDRAIAGQAVLDPFPYLAVGRRVRVAKGAMMGLEGLIDEKLSPMRLVLNVSMLGRALSLEIDAAALEVV